jgi:hypothetical protein
MKKIILFILSAFLLSACNGWVIQPLPMPTPFMPATVTPSIFTATPVIIGVTSVSVTPAIATATPFATNTSVPIVIPTDTSIIPPTSIPGMPAIAIQVLGCNTSIDIMHGMGEVTNAFVTLKNTGNVELTNLRVTLFALDEGREHPDKTVELTSLPAGYQVSLKLTVDSTYKQESAIQVEVVSDQGAFPREGSPSCRDIGIFAPNPASLNTPAPSP